MARPVRRGGGGRPRVAPHAAGAVPRRAAAGIVGGRGRGLRPLRVGGRAAVPEVPPGRVAGRAGRRAPGAGGGLPARPRVRLPGAVRAAAARGSQRGSAAGAPAHAGPDGRDDRLGLLHGRRRAGGGPAGRGAAARGPARALGRAGPRGPERRVDVAAGGGAGPESRGPVAGSARRAGSARSAAGRTAGRRAGTPGAAAGRAGLDAGPRGHSRGAGAVVPRGRHAGPDRLRAGASQPAGRGSRAPAGAAAGRRGTRPAGRRIARNLRGRAGAGRPAAVPGGAAGRSGRGWR